MLPLYKEFQLQGAEANPGLLFDKFVAGWSDDWNAKLENKAKRDFFYEFTQDDYRNYLQVNLKTYLQTQEHLVDSLCGLDTEPFLYVKTDWRFVSGLGSGHPYETGFIWHRTLGVPYLPGSSVKGLMRAWLEQWNDGDDTTLQTVQRLFGVGPDPGLTAKDEAGALIVFDALPARVPKLELDILNPHYGPYYQDPEHNPPADYYSPVPIFFLTVAAGQLFRFCLAPRPGARIVREKDVEQGLELLQAALETLGAGGKTAVGYGTFEADPDVSKREKEKRLREREKALPLETRLRSELQRIQPEQLITALSRNWSKTKKKYGADLSFYLQIVAEVHGDTIQKWQNSDSKNKQKAYRKIFNTSGQSI